jgi:hypothetical protein
MAPAVRGHRGASVPVLENLRQVGWRVALQTTNLQEHSGQQIWVSLFLRQPKDALTTLREKEPEIESNREHP